MNIDEAAIILKEMYDGAPRGEKTTSAMLFGIKYAHELEGVPTTEIVARSGLPKSYEMELNNGKNLARYVEVI